MAFIIYCIDGNETGQVCHDIWLLWQCQNCHLPVRGSILSLILKPDLWASLAWAWFKVCNNLQGAFFLFCFPFTSDINFVHAVKMVVVWCSEVGFDWFTCEGIISMSWNWEVFSKGFSCFCHIILWNVAWSLALKEACTSKFLTYAWWL